MCMIVLSARTTCVPFGCQKKASYLLELNSHPLQERYSLFITKSSLQPCLTLSLTGVSVYSTNEGLYASRPYPRQSHGLARAAVSQLQIGGAQDLLSWVLSIAKLAFQE